MAGAQITSTPYNVNDHIVCDSSNKFEKEFGYHRAIRKGPFIFVSGTTALGPNGQVACPGDATGQAHYAFRLVIKAVEALGGTKEDVVRVRMFVASNNDAGAVGLAFRETFGQTPPNDTPDLRIVTGTSATMIVSGKDSFVDPEMLVEVEVDAVV